MNREVLLAAEKSFLASYPAGFDNPDLVAYGKKFKMAQHEAFARERFAKGCFEDPDQILADFAGLVSRSALVSVFEKPKFKQATAGLKGRLAEPWADAVYDLLHAKQKAGFEALVQLLAEHRLAKWTLVSLLPAYYRPQRELFVKPSTAKLIVRQLELPLTYHSKPTWDFYRDLRKAIHAMREVTDSSLAPSNAAYCGFLMIALRGGERM